MSSNNRRARIYRIAAAGRRQLEGLALHPYDVHAEGAPVAYLQGVRSCLLFGCVVTGAAFGQQTAHNQPSGGIPVDVCMEPAQELRMSTKRAKSLVSLIYSQIGVNLTWYPELSQCDPSVCPTIRIRWAKRAPSTSSDGALASARPFGSPETSITIYEVPLQRFLNQYANSPEVVLAYVLAHELAHAMQGLDHHSASGILKARWSYSEYYRMLSRTLTFTAEDVDLIRMGLAAKRLKIAGRQGAPQSQTEARRPTIPNWSR